MPLDSEVPFQDLTYKIIGAAMHTHSRLRPGLKEEHYQRALANELREEGLPVSEEYIVEIHDNAAWLGRLYIDLLIGDAVIVENKSISHLLTNEEIAQVLCYLSATGYKVGLLLNFGRERLQYKRILPPRIIQGWQQKIQRFLWRPPDLIQPPKG